MDGLLDAFKKMEIDESEKTAWIIMGRWQPFHKGHYEIVKKLYNDMEEKNKNKNKDKRIDLFIVISETENIEKNSSNPLTQSVRIKYILKMFPFKEFPKLNILWTDNIDNDMLAKKKFDTRLNGKMSGRSWSTNITAKLQKRKYSKIIIHVGEDRYEAFKKNNEKWSDKVFVERVGKPRGVMGKRHSFTEEEINIGSLLIDIAHGIKNNDNDKLSDDMACSGSQMRKFAIDGNLTKFCKQMKYGDMTYKDCLDLANYIRSGMKEKKISLEEIKDANFKNNLENEIKKEQIIKSDEGTTRTNIYRLNPSIRKFIGGKNKTKKYKSKKKKRKTKKKRRKILTKKRKSKQRKLRKN
jgi:hypothetical protein